MKKLFALITIILILSCYNTSAFIFEDGVEIVVGNETYGFNATVNFSQIVIASDYLIVNNTRFDVESANAITINITFLSGDVAGASEGEVVFDFYADTNAGNVWFNISGVTTGTRYRIDKNGTLLTYFTGNATNYISFSNNDWSRRFFEVLRRDMPILISNVYPVNSTNIYVTQPTVFFDLNYSSGALMNYSIYVGNSTANCTDLLTSVNNVANGTYHYTDYYDAVSFYVSYYWKVSANNGSNWLNETYNFQAILQEDAIITTPGFEIFMLLGAVAVSMLLLKQRKK